MTEAIRSEQCKRCGGIGQAVKRINRRRDGSISSIVYDLKNDCGPCKGTGLACMEVSRG
ncbi:RecJ-like exonuclease [Agrobacterium vitis]|nr:RecJ-like exonuclease [Agrobacterium vitis]MBE1439840.1 RecJ-like exonuclease [Agrobacterium vitis]